MVGALSFVCGAMFAAGVCLSGMVRPSKVLGFLNLSGDWDPSLALVMGSAVAIYALAWAIARRRTAPMLGGAYPAAPSRTVDARLVGGAALFGAGWGLGGFCPGPALVSIVSGVRASLVFVAAMAVGMLVYQWLDARQGRTDEASSELA